MATSLRLGPDDTTPLRRRPMPRQMDPPPGFMLDPRATVPGAFGPAMPGGFAGLLGNPQPGGVLGGVEPDQPQGLLGGLLGPGPHPFANWLGDHSATFLGVGLPMALSHWEKDVVPGVTAGLQSGQQVDFARVQARDKKRREDQQQAALDKLYAQYGNIAPAGTPAEVGAPLLTAAMKPRSPGEGFINAGNGNVYDAVNGRWLTAPGTTAKPPNIETLFGEHGEEVKGFWAPDDPRAGADGFVRLPGAKAPSGMHLSVGADGQVEFVQGSGAGDLTTSTRTGLQGKRISSQDALARLDAIQQTFRPEYTTLVGKASNALRSWQAYVLGEDSLSPADRKALREFSTWQARTYANLNQYLHDLSGAAITPQEAVRLQAALPSVDDDPVNFRAKLDDVIAQTQEAIARYEMQMGQGTPAAPGGFEAAPTPPRAYNRQTGKTVEWNGTTWVPVD